MPQLATNSNQLADELLYALSNETPVSEFSRARFLRQARSQLDQDRKHAMLALAYTVSGDREQARSEALSAVEVMSQEATMAVALLTLHINGFHEEVLRVRGEHEEILKHPGYSIGFAISLHCLPIIKELRFMKDTCLKTKATGQAKGMLTMCEHYISKVDEAKEHFDIQDSDIDTVTRFAAEIADQFSGITMRSPTFERSPLGECFNLIYNVQVTEEFEHDLFDLNLGLADKLIEADLDSLPMIARFTRIAGSPKGLAESLDMSGGH